MPTSDPVCSADLAPSNMTLMKMYGDFQKGQYQEKNLRYGVREHGMGAIANGIALHNPGMIPYCATFFNFTDYMRGAIRMAALSRVCSPQRILAAQVGQPVHSYCQSAAALLPD